MSKRTLTLAQTLDAALTIMADGRPRHYKVLAALVAERENANLLSSAPVHLYNAGYYGTKGLTRVDGAKGVIVLAPQGITTEQQELAASAVPTSANVREQNAMLLSQLAELQAQLAALSTKDDESKKGK